MQHTVALDCLLRGRFQSLALPGKGSDMRSNHKQLCIRERKDKPWVKDIHGPLYQRAWCLQERLMSRALLHLERMGWRGNVAHRQSSRVASLGKRRTLTLRHYSSSIRRSHCSLPCLFLNTQFDKTWREFVRLYTSRKLTFDKDRLIAAAGLAQSFQTVHPGEYLAGIWKEDLPRGLLWHLGPASQNEEVFHRPGEPLKANAFLELGSTPRGVYYESKILDQDFDDPEAWFNLQIQAYQVPKGGACRAFNRVKGGTLKVLGLL
jgi:hypothetical protein